MAKDDYHVIAYRMLAYLYACLKECQKVNTSYLECDTVDFPIGKDYWYYILKNLYESEYITGIAIMPVLNNSVTIKINRDITITPKGIEYLQSNSSMQKAFDFLKGLKEIVPGL